MNILDNILLRIISAPVFILFWYPFTSIYISGVSGPALLPAVAGNQAAPGIPLLLAVAGFVVLGGAALLIYMKLRKAKHDISDRDSKIEDMTSELEKARKEIASQYELTMKKYSESDSYFSTLVRSYNDGIIFYDKDWNIIFTNSSLYELAGYSKESYLTLNPRDIFSPENEIFPSDRTEILKRDGIYEHEISIRNREGRFINLMTRSFLVKGHSEELMGFITIVRDITPVKLLQQELNDARVEAEKSNRLKSSFLANISHEIRTPLNAVVGFSNLLLSNDLSHEIKAEYIEHINRNSEKLLQIIGDIIDLSRLESSQIEITYEESSLNEIIGEIMEETRKTIARNEKPIVLNVKSQPLGGVDLIFTDRLWLSRVISHLMDNAVKFTLEGSVEFIYAIENENIVFKIKDTGIGIDRANLNRIFEEFSQEKDGHRRPFEGLGVGLTLAKEVIERMGGKIFVESEKGVGSEFSFTIPYRPAGRVKSKARFYEQTVRPVDWTSKKCLLVDDNKDVLLYLNRILLDTGVGVITARSGPEAIEIIRKTPDIDVILLDMQMPGMNGIEATKEIRKIRKNLPIIAQTAFIFEDDKDIIIEAGCDACLIKPIRKEHLLSAMACFIRPN
jgi:PAS domain S-box-containing protein